MPKSIALQRPEATALSISRPMAFFAVVFSPLIWLLNGIGNFLLRRLGFHAAEGHSQVHSPEELDMLFTESHKGGEINLTEFEILHRVVRFSDTSARAIMVPRLEMQALPLAISRNALTDFLQGRPHSRIPVYQDSMDQIIGIVNSKDLEHLNYEELSQEVENLKTVISDHNGAQPVLAASQATDADAKILDLTPLVLEVAFVPETIRIDGLLTEFKKRRQQMAIVIDEYGSAAGLVTLADLLEQVFGDLPDETEEPEILRRPDGSIQLAGLVSIDDVNELFGFGFHSDEADTMAGLVLNALGRTASVGDEVEINGLRIRVEKVDHLRIASLLLFLPADGNAETPPSGQAD
jgi:CBS domain containing-hemolysin-like protein